jgi:predicted ATPase
MHPDTTTGRLPLLIGRQRELTSLLRHVEAARDGHPGVALIVGAAGIGKTRLLDELAARAAGSGGRVLRGGGSETEGMPPYLPFLEALGQHIRTTDPDTIRAQVGAFAPVLATILPELPSRLGQTTASYSLPPEQSRMRLYEAVSSFLGAIAAPGGLVLILDDLQWVDPASLDLLCFIARYQQTAQPSARMFVLAAAREGEAAYPDAFERASTELNRLRLLTTCVC